MKNFIPQIQLMAKHNIQEYFSISRATFYRLKKNRLFPEPITIENGIAYWDKEDIDDFIKNIKTNNS